MLTTRTSLVCLLLLVSGCERAKAASGEAATTTAPGSSAALVPASVSVAAASPSPAATPVVAAAPVLARVGKAAPAFKLKDLDGRPVSLSDFKGKVVVLEWFNPGCPFVRAAHTKGSLVDAAKRAKKNGIVWLAINSGAPGQQGHGIEANRKGCGDLWTRTPALARRRRVGRTNLRGGADAASVRDRCRGDACVRWWQWTIRRTARVRPPKAALWSATSIRHWRSWQAKKPVSVPSTKAYGCSVKYGK